jgi:hypothetical protein
MVTARPQEEDHDDPISAAHARAERRVSSSVDADAPAGVHKTPAWARSGLSNVLTGNVTLEQAIATSPHPPGTFYPAAGTPPRIGRESPLRT